VAESAVFDFTSDRLHALSGLDALAARGTLRIALRDSGFDAKGVGRAQMEAILDRVLPAMLRSRGVAAADEVCTAIAAELMSFEGAAAASALPEAFVARTRAGR
jgi:hypothetical protein